MPRLLWRAALALPVLLSLIATSTTGATLTAIAIGVLLLCGLKAGLFYVALGRTTLREPDGSGFTDLDVLEEELAEAPGTDGLTKQELKELRARYGRRVPNEAIQAWINNKLANVEAMKRQAIANAKVQGRTMSIHSLRTSLLNAQPPGAEARDYQAHCEVLLLRLEVEYGTELPLSVVVALADQGYQTPSGVFSPVAPTGR